MNPLFATAIIEFVGLCMFKEGDQKFPVHVVLPNVQQAAVPHHHPPVAQRGDIQLVQNRRRVPVNPRESVEQEQIITMDQHTAIIAWLGAPESVQGWTPKTLKPVPQYQYVELKGEQIRIVPNGRNEPPKVPAVLPKVTHMCSDTLAPNYTAKSAGIVKIEEGKLTACHPRINGVPSSRVDTTLEFETDGPIVIQTLGSPFKKLVLKSADLVIIGNVPSAWVNSDPDTAESLHNEAGHYRGFYTVLTGGGAGCAHQRITAPVCDRDGPQFGAKGPADPKGPTSETSRVAAGAVASPRTFNTDYKVWREGVARPASTPTDGACPNCFMTYACSNSQYP